MLLALPGARRALFLGSDDGSGVELWRTDGTPAGTVLHQDLSPGPASSNPLWAARLAGASLYFAAEDVTAGREPWTLRSFAAAIPFGAGCAGAGGSTPELVVRGGAPVIGNAAFALEVRGGRPGAVALLVLAKDCDEDEPERRCVVRVDGPLALMYV